MPDPERNYVHENKPTPPPPENNFRHSRIRTASLGVNADRQKLVEEEQAQKAREDVERDAKKNNTGVGVAS